MSRNAACIAIALLVGLLAASAPAAPIHDAAAKGGLAEVRALIGYDAKLVEAEDSDGAAPLHYAAAGGQKAVALFLLASGAQVNKRKKDGVTPLHVAAAMGRREVVEILISKRADANAVDDKGRTPLSLAIQHRRPDISNVLLGRCVPLPQVDDGIRRGKLDVSRGQAIVRKPGAPGTKAVTFSQTIISGCPVNVITVDMNDSRAHVQAAVTQTGIGGSESFGSFVRRLLPTAAINGTFFSKDNWRPIGDIVVNGELVHFGAQGTGVCFTDDGRVDFVTVIRHNHADWDEYKTVICAGPRLLKDGYVIVDPAAEGFRDPHVLGRGRRTAVGLTPPNKLLLANTGKAVTLREWANVMKALGCIEAVNFDGGASVAMYYRGRTISSPGRQLTNVLLVYENLNAAGTAAQ